MFDEMLGSDSQNTRQPYERLMAWLDDQDLKKLYKKSATAEELFRRVGITFNVYGDKKAEERLIPFDLIPRILSAKEWRMLERGIIQRVAAINAFLEDIYNGQQILKAGIIPEDLIYKNKAFLPQMCGFKPPGGVYTHVVGVDIVRTSENEFFVLEDNARVPSGVSYMLENRSTMQHMFPELFTTHQIKPISNYPKELFKSLALCAENTFSDPNIVVLTPGIYNSAYYEHSFLADEMGVELVQGSDLKIHDGRVMIRTTTGTQNVDVIYRRVDDDFLDPLSFNPNSLLGTPGLFDAYRNGSVILANAPGTGIADDKAIYYYIPEIIKFYTGERALLNNIPTWRCSEADNLQYVLEHLHELVVKEVHGSGGYGMLVGPAASKREIAAFRRKLKANPRKYIAQPTLALSTVPILTRNGLAPRHVDLRPFVLVSPNSIEVTPGGLTRVALKKGSLVVNSSQGGGTKDTWVIGS
ncbi:circularly permuted type 2 ATP-grasp protein [Alphaproteobacteria bacterium LSUCC0744]